MNLPYPKGFSNWGWFALSLLVPLHYGFWSWRYLHSDPYIVQDDVRLHLVWMQRWIDPRLFANDAIADYFNTIQLPGFQALYGALAQLGIGPLVAASVLPTVLSLIATVYLFRLAHLLLPLTAAGFWVTLIFNQNIWIKDDLISATPRAFVYPLFAAFLYYLAKRAYLGCGVTLVLQGLVYPQLLLVSVGTLTLRLGRWRGRLQLSRCWQDYVLWLTGLALALAVAVVFSSAVSAQYGPVATAAQMQALPEFHQGGRAEYYSIPPIYFWFRGASGIRIPLFPPIILIALALPVLFYTWRPTRQITSHITLLRDVALASVGLFGLAHLAFSRLYLPSRYSYYSARVVMAIATGLMLTLFLQQFWRWWRRPVGKQWAKGLAGGLVGLALLVVVTVPLIPSLFLSGQNWVEGQYPGLYDFLARQPKSTLVASLTREADNLPAFAQRSVLFSRELALPYHPGFYAPMSLRLRDIVQAQYSPQLSKVNEVIETYGVDFWLLDRQFDQAAYLRNRDWLMHTVVRAEVAEQIDQLQTGQTPALAETVGDCTALAEKDLVLLDAACIRAATAMAAGQSSDHRAQ